jgi:hypothetical protein
LVTVQRETGICGESSYRPRSAGGVGGIDTAARPPRKARATSATAITAYTSSLSTGNTQVRGTVTAVLLIERNGSDRKVAAIGRRCGHPGDENAGRSRHPRGGAAGTSSRDG